MNTRTTISQKRIALKTIKTKRNPKKSSKAAARKKTSASAQMSIHDIFGILINNPIEGLPPDASETKLRF